jgi:DinB family protein
MRTRAELASVLLDHGAGSLRANVKELKLDEALDAGDGYRSALGILKHTAAWSHVYHSYAFEVQPRHWRGLDWPRRLRDTVETSQSYLDEVIAWLAASQMQWQTSLAGLSDDDFDLPRPCHWGATAPLFDIVVMVATHWTYHAGEINEILAIRRGEAWEYTEEVEENHISTAGHRMRPQWMSDEQAARYEAYLAGRDRELHPGL